MRLLARPGRRTENIRNEVLLGIGERQSRDSHAESLNRRETSCKRQWLRKDIPFVGKRLCVLQKELADAKWWLFGYKLVKPA